MATVSCTECDYKGPGEVYRDSGLADPECPNCRTETLKIV